MWKKSEIPIFALTYSFSAEGLKSFWEIKRRKAKIFKIYLVFSKIVSLPSEYISLALTSTQISLTLFFDTHMLFLSH